MPQSPTLNIATSGTAADLGIFPTIPIDTDAKGVGLANPQLSTSRRRMIDLVNRLQSTGVQVDIDLPQIAVIGSQSAGKSSLIESISGITLPRAAGTCTRCPTECKLARASGPWSCTVALRFTTDARGQPLGQVRNEAFGPPITHKADVEERIRRAQRAILSPSTASRQYLEGDDEDGESELTFSTNCVSLQISGPDVADLSFCDLPGLIASVGRGGNANDIELVERLVSSYICKPSCLILLTVACETDFENQGAHRLAKANDPDGKRTIGVLTKPDRIPSGEEESWLRFIRNEVEPLENNWYCVKQPNSSALKQGISWVQARTQENEFFSMTPPWSELDVTYQQYLRTSNLTERLSSILSELISKRLPAIQDELQKLLRKTEEGLRSLPKAPSRDAFGEIMHLMHIFSADLSRHLEGIPEEDGLLQAIRPAQEKFKRAIQSTAPLFRPYNESSDHATLEEPMFLANEDIAMGDATSSPVSANIIYIDEVLGRAMQARTRQLPGSYPFVVQEWYITSIVKQWETPAKMFYAAVQKILTEHMKSLVAQHFAGIGQGGLEQGVKVIVADHIAKCCSKAEEKIEWLLHIEDRPFTLNTHYLAGYRDKFLTYYKGSRNADANNTMMSRIHAYRPSTRITDKHGNAIDPTGVPKALSGLAEIGLSGVRPEDLPRLLPPDAMDPALIIMADVRAYFQVAHKRFVDNVPLAIDHELVRGMEREFLPALYGGLGISGPEGQRISREFVQENPRIASRREELTKKWERLHGASKELLHIGV